MLITLELCTSEQAYVALQPGLHRGSTMAASAKKSPGALTEEALHQYGDTSSLDLIDIGINLADPSFDEVCFHQPGLPNAWPCVYDQSAQVQTHCQFLLIAKITGALVEHARCQRTTCRNLQSSNCCCMKKAAHIVWLMSEAHVQDRDAVISRAILAGVSAMVITGSSLKSSARARDICSTASNGAALYFTAGVHPHEAKSCDEQTLPALRELAAHPRCCAIGECGLDFKRRAILCCSLVRKNGNILSPGRIAVPVEGKINREPVSVCHPHASNLTIGSEIP